MIRFVCSDKICDGKNGTFSAAFAEATTMPCDNGLDYWLQCLSRANNENLRQLSSWGDANRTNDVQPVRRLSKQISVPVTRLHRAAINDILNTHCNKCRCESIGASGLEWNGKGQSCANIVPKSFGCRTDQWNQYSTTDNGLRMMCWLMDKG